MDGKSASSGWSIIRTPIKIAISAWPIVFAAVVAQAFKTWATFRVERGVKLMELEQLVGSNSFASALKQPFFLRRLNILMLVMLAIWCLSPLGSQALQWIYSLERHSTTEHIDVQYLKRYGTNRVLSSDTPVDEAQLAELVQAVSVYYTGSLMPSNVVQFEIRGSHVVGPYQDQYTHPLLAGAGFYGLPIALPVAKLADAILLQSSTDAALAVTQPMYETLSFPVTASQYKFASCTAFQPKKGSDITDLSFSPSQTLGLGLSFSSSADPSTASGTIRFATRVNLPAAPANLFPSTKDGGSQTPDPTDSSAWDYEYAECTFSQVFITTSITCAANVDTGGGTYSCVADNEQDSSYATLDPAQVDKSWYTNLVDFSDVWAASHANPFSDYAPTTPSKFCSMPPTLRFLGLLQLTERQPSGTLSRPRPRMAPLTNLTPPAWSRTLKTHSSSKTLPHCSTRSSASATARNASTSTLSGRSWLTSRAMCRASSKPCQRSTRGPTTSSSSSTAAGWPC